MLTRAAWGKPLATAAMVMVVMAGFAMPAEAGKWARREARLSSCNDHQSLVRIDTKTCPATKRRPALVLRRACCQNPRGKVMCKPFHPCPPNSPS